MAQKYDRFLSIQFIGQQLQSLQKDNVDYIESSVEFNRVLEGVIDTIVAIIGGRFGGRDS